MPDINENKIVKKWYFLIPFDKFLDDAAGRVSSELIIKIPTHFIDKDTIEDTNIINNVLYSLKFTLLLIAKSLLKLEIKKSLNRKIQKSIESKNIINKNRISLFFIDKISPIKKLEYFERPPFIVINKIPSDNPIDEKTPIIVSDEDFSDSITNETDKANKIEKIKDETS